MGKIKKKLKEFAKSQKLFNQKPVISKRTKDNISDFLKDDKVYGPASGIRNLVRNVANPIPTVVKNVGKFLKEQKKLSTGPMKPFMMNPGSKEIDTPGTFRQDSKAMMFKMNKEKDSIKEFTPEMKKQARLGGSGSMGIVGGAAGKVAKGVSTAAKQFWPVTKNTGDLYKKARARKALGNDAKAGITFSKPNPTGIKGTGKSRVGSVDLITGGRSLKSMKSGKKKPTPFSQRAFDAFGEATMQYQRKLPFKYKKK